MSTINTRAIAVAGVPLLCDGANETVDAFITRRVAGTAHVHPIPVGLVPPGT